MGRVTEKHLKRSIKETLKHPNQENFSRMRAEFSKKPALWREVYTDSEDVESFRKWLKLVHDPANSRFVDFRYGSTAITALCGFMTFRHLYLCCENFNDLRTPGAVSSHDELVQFADSRCYVDYFIPQESLEDSLCEAVEKVRPLTSEEKDRIYKAQKTNTSKRKLTISDYYDEESIELIRRRDRLLIDKFGYSPPSIS